MTSLSMARELVYAHFLQEHSAYPVFAGFNPDRLDRRGDLNLAAEGGAAHGQVWVRIVVRHTNREQETLGPRGRRRFRNEATIFASVFVPLSIVDGPVFQADRYAQAMIEIFDSKRIINADDSVDFIQTYASIPRDRAPETSQLEIMVETPISYDERA